MTKTKRFIAADIVRIAACLIVLGNHVAPNASVESVYVFSRTLNSVFYSDGVGVFFMLTGFFLFRGRPYKAVLSNTFSRIILPLLACVLFYHFLYAFATDPSVGLLTSIHMGIENFGFLISELLRWSNPVSKYGGHLWYLFVYVFLMLIYPIISAFVKYLDEDAGRERLFIVVSFLIMAWNDVERNMVLEFTSHALRGAIPAALFCIWGHIAWKHKDSITTKKSLVLGPLLFLILNIIRAQIELVYANLYEGNNSIMYWWTTFGLLCSLCLVSFCFSIASLIRKKELENVLIRVAGCTFEIYLIHLYIRQLLMGKTSFFIAFSEILLKHPLSFSRVFIYTLLAATILFAVCLAIVIPIQATFRFIRNRSKRD